MAFAAAYAAKCPGAVAKVTDDLDVPVAFDNRPADGWAYVRTTNRSDRR